MKLPKERDRYEHNKYLDRLLLVAKLLAEDAPPVLMPVTDKGVYTIGAGNLKHVKEMMAMLEHVELALEEILQLRDKR